MAGECIDPERRRAWLDLAKQWVELAEQVAFRGGALPRIATGARTALNGSEAPAASERALAHPGA
jgi:hypothetical protein